MYAPFKLNGCFCTYNVCIMLLSTDYLFVLIVDIICHLQYNNITLKSNIP